MFNQFQHIRSRIDKRTGSVLEECKEDDNESKICLKNGESGIVVMVPQKPMVDSSQIKNKIMDPGSSPG